MSDTRGYPVLFHFFSVSFERSCPPRLDADERERAKRVSDVLAVLDKAADEPPIPSDFDFHGRGPGSLADAPALRKRETIPAREETGAVR